MEEFSGKNPNRIAIIHAILFLSCCAYLLLGSSACVSEALTRKSTPTSEVVATAFAAAISGELVNGDGCIRLRRIGIDHTILWPPDASWKIEGDHVRIVTGIVRKQPKEVIVHFGEIVTVGGGEIAFPDEQLLQSVPPHCRQGPYWVMGFEITIVSPTATP